MKKITALLLVLAMAVTLFAGCGDKSSAPEAPAAESSEEAAPQATTQISEHEAAEDVATPALVSGAVDLEGDLSSHWLCPEKQTLTILTYDGVNSSYEPPSNDLWFWQVMEKYTNVHIEWEVAPYSGYGEVVNTRLSGGVNLPDIVMSNGNRTTKNAGDNGVLIDLYPYWDSCFTNTKNYFDTLGLDFLTYIQNPTGEIYALPNAMSAKESHICFMYNTLWLKELGMEPPTTLDEFTNLMYAMQAAGDLNHNGLNDEICLTSSGVNILMSVLGNAFNLEQYEGWDAYNADENGVVYSEYTTENMRECLKYMNKLYADGVLDPEILATSADSMGEKIASDRVGCFVFYAGFAVSYGMLTSAGQQDPAGEWYTIGMPLASEWNGNEGYLVCRPLAFGNGGAAITYECTQRELAAKWLDTLYADPTILWARVYGKENETWKWGADGEVELIVDENGDWDPTYLGVLQISLPFIQTQEEMVNDSREWYIHENDLLRECKWVSASVPKVSVFTEEEEEMKDDVYSDVGNYWLEWRDKFIAGIMDLDTDWDTYVNSINSVGMTQLTRVYQMVYDRLKDKQ